MQINRPPYFDEARSALQLYADELLPGEWTEADTLEFLEQADLDNCGYDPETEEADFMEVLRENANEFVMDKVAFPHNLELQREIAQSDITESEVKLFKMLEPTGSVDDFIGTLRNADFHMYEGDLRSGVVSQKVLDVVGDMLRSDLETFMSHDNWVERLAAAEVACEIVGGTAPARHIIVSCSDRLIDAFNNGEITGDEHIEVFQSLEESLIEMGYEEKDIAFVTQQIAEVPTISSSIESGVIQSKEVLDGVLSAMTSKPAVKAKRM